MRMRDMFQAAAVAVVLLAVLVMASGCGMLGGMPSGPDLTSATVPSDQRTPIVLTQESVDVLTHQGVTEAKILAEALSAVQDQGSVIYVNHEGYVWGPDAKPIFDAAGQPLKMRTQIVAKLNSMHALQNMQGVEQLEYLVGGVPHLTGVRADMQNVALSTAPVPLYLSVRGVNAASVDSRLPEVIQARAAERDAILRHLPAIVREQYVGQGKVIQATADGLVTVLTATGQAVTGVLLAANPTSAAIGATASGLKLVLADPQTGIARTVILPDATTAPTGETGGATQGE